MPTAVKEPKSKKSDAIEPALSEKMAQYFQEHPEALQPWLEQVSPNLQVVPKNINRQTRVGVQQLFKGGAKFEGELAETYHSFPELLDSLDLSDIDPEKPRELTREEIDKMARINRVARFIEDSAKGPQDKHKEAIFGHITAKTGDPESDGVVYSPIEGYKFSRQVEYRTASESISYESEHERATALERRLEQATELLREAFGDDWERVSSVRRLRLLDPSKLVTAASKGIVSKEQIDALSVEPTTILKFVPRPTGQKDDLSKGL